MGLSSRCGCRCECVTTTTHGDVVRNRNNDVAPDAVLEGLAVAGLVAILRQLGDLAECVGSESLVLEVISSNIIEPPAHAGRFIHILRMHDVHAAAGLPRRCSTTCKTK